MTLLIVAAMLWVGVHRVAGTRLRDAVVARIGEGSFRGLCFSAFDPCDGVRSWAIIVTAWQRAPLRLYSASRLCPPVPLAELFALKRPLRLAVTAER